MSLPKTKKTEWIFGYGSLIWRPSFPFVAKQPAILHGWCRRFYQGSPDHRGTPQQPGRVVTLLPKEGANCYGMAYQVAEEVLHEVLMYLDVREQGGYQVLNHPVSLLNGVSVDALVYIAGPENEHYVGPASAVDIAAHIFGCTGPSGRNRDYVYQLSEALAAFAPPESHVHEIVVALHALEQLDKK